MSVAALESAVSRRESTSPTRVQAARTPRSILFLALDVDLRTERGETVHTIEFAKALAKRGHHIALVTATPQAGVPALGSGVRHYVRPSRSDWKQVHSCLRIAREISANVVYERRLSPKIAFAVSRLLGIPFVVEVNGVEDETALLGRRPPPWRRATLPIRRRFYRSASAVVAVTESLSALIQELYGLPESRVAVVPNGADVERFVPVDAGDARKRLGWPPGNWVVFVGDLVPWQGLDALLHAFHLVRERQTEARLAIVGDGILRSSLEHLARQLGFDGHVLFTGAVRHEDVPWYIGAASVCVAPFTRARNVRIGLSPLKLYEYLACARPVVASDVPGARDIVEDSGAGLVAPADDPEGLAEALIRALADPDAAREMGQLGRRYATEFGSWAKTAERVEGVFRKILNPSLEARGGQP